MEHLIELGVFFGKLLLAFLFIAGLAAIVAGLAMRNRMKSDLEVQDINLKLSDIASAVRSVVLDKKALKAFEKAEKAKEKAEEDSTKKTIFVLKFHGDMHAHQVEEFRDEITSVLSVAKQGDEVVVGVESPGGTVHGYGLAAAQIVRLRDAGLTVTVCVDKIAASGGYMMACVANKILAAPFAIIGSIGVLAQVPNLHRLLKKHDIDYEEITAGDYKRTVSLLGEITEKGRVKFTEQIEDTHNLFKSFVSEHRPQVDIAKVATGEYWFGTRAKALGLVDEISTSDDYIFRQRETARIFTVKVNPHKNFAEKLEEWTGRTAASTADRLLSQLNLSRFL